MVHYGCHIPSISKAFFRGAKVQISRGSLGTLALKPAWHLNDTTYRGPGTIMDKNWWFNGDLTMVNNG